MSGPAWRRRAFIMAWDGMRPDLISPSLTTSLARLADEGVLGLDHHTVYPTVTRVNSASLSTGVLPSRHGSWDGSPDAVA